MSSEVHVFVARAATFLSLATVGLVVSPDRAAAQATDAAAGQKVYAQVCLGCERDEHDVEIDRLEVERLLQPGKSRAGWHRRRTV